MVNYDTFIIDFGLLFDRYMNKNLPKFYPNIYKFYDIS